VLSIKVNYIWSEYIKVLTDFAPIISYKEKHGVLPPSHVNISLWQRIGVYSFGSIMFAIKVRKVGLCTFEFDDRGFERKSNVGTKFIAWDDVFHIHPLTNAYLMELEQGFIPLPYRCFNGTKNTEFKSIISSKLIK